MDGGFPFDLVGRRRLDEDVQTDAVASWLMSRDRYLGKLRSPVVRPRRLKMRAASWANVLSPGNPQALLFQRERSCDDLACRLVRSDRDSSRGDLAVYELQPGGNGAFREQAFAGPDDEREDPKAVLVD